MTMKALDASIEKWEKNCKAKNFSEVLVGPNSCPLCLLYNESFLTNTRVELQKCKGCPIQEYVEMPGCINTPYTSCEEANEDNDFEEFQIHARRELAFLKEVKQWKLTGKKTALPKVEEF